MAHVYKWIDSPVGRLQLVANDEGLAAVLWDDDFRSFRHMQDLKEDDGNPILVQTEKELGEYFDGKRDHFDVALAFEGTEFQKAVWEALVSIPFGECRTYGEIARQIGRPKASRAVGAAAGMNPIAIIAPCHRVLGASGTLTGFAGGLEAKKRLLKIEGVEHGDAGKESKLGSARLLGAQMAA